MKTKIWLGIGCAVIAGSAPAGNVPVPLAGAFGAAPAYAEGGEGGEGGGALASYSLASTDPNAFQYNGRPQVEAYVDLVRSSYAKAAADAAQMQAAIGAFLQDPSEEKLAAARRAWAAARPSYLVTEAFRFYDGPIEEVEPRINSWPLNEAAIDYVEGDAQTGIVNRLEEPLTIEALNEANQNLDEADVTTGWHAIEFLLWGQDKSATGPGARPASDYAAGSASNDRRRSYLALATRELVDDLAALHERWTTSDGDAYSAKFLGLDQREALGRMLNGLAVLAGFELMSERIAVALDSGDQEDEHSCFSDTTHQDFVYDLAGIKAVWTGDGAGQSRPGLDELLRSIDSAMADRIDALMADAESKIATLGDPWDQVLAADPQSPLRQAAEAAVTALGELAGGFKQAGRKLGVLVLIPSS